MTKLASSISAEEVASLVRAHLDLQMGCYFTKQQSCLSGIISTSEWIDDFYWNSLSSFREPDLRELLTAAEPVFKAARRPISVYMDPTCTPGSAGKDLESEGFICEREIWMSFDGELPTEADPNLSIRAVNSGDHEDFLRIFSLAFGGPATSADGYGDLPPSYLAALRGSLEGAHARGVEHIHLIAYMDKQPVGCGSIHVGRAAAGLYNVGTLPAARNRGVGAAISREAVHLARKRGAEIVFFQTQPGGSVQSFYEHIGCKIIFEAAMYHR